MRYCRKDCERHTLESPDDKGGGGGNDSNRSLTILDCELNGHPQTLPSTGSLGDIFTDFFGRLKAVRVLLERTRNIMQEHTRPRGPILGARAEEAPTSPPVARR
jgi:hypothetical protein